MSLELKEKQMASNWQPLGGVIDSAIAVGRNADDRLELFVRGTDGQVYHRWQVAPSSTVWNPDSWQPLGGVIIGSVAVGQNADGRLELRTTPHGFRAEAVTAARILQSVGELTMLMSGR
jgi:hypothetical protein